MHLLTIASLTLREAARRRVFAAVAVVTVLAITVTGWGMAKIHESLLARHANSYELVGTFPILVLLMAYMFSVVLGVGAAFIAAPAIASDVDSGVVLALLPRPIRRSDLVLGKWLALAVLVVCYTFCVGALQLLLVHALSGYLPPHPVVALTFLSAEALLLLTLALALGTRLPPIAAGIVAVVLFGLTWIGGIAQSIALALRNESVIHATTIVSLILPTDAMWRSAAYALEPAAMAAAALTDLGRQSPFTVGAPPPTAFAWWTLAWVVAALSIAVVSFQRRDL